MNRTIQAPIQAAAILTSIPLFEKRRLVREPPRNEPMMLAIVSPIQPPPRIINEARQPTIKPVTNHIGHIQGVVEILKGAGEVGVEGGVATMVAVPFTLGVIAGVLMVGGVGDELPKLITRCWLPVKNS